MAYYYKNLLELDQKINSYKELPLDKWHWYSWQGFYSEIQSTLKTGTWKYVSNPSGGFLGFWWYSHYSEYKENNFEFYLQIEQDKLIFKLHSKNPEDRKEIRSYYRNKLYLVAKEMGINIKQYGRIGKTMSVAKLVENYRKTNSDGTINMKETIKTLQSVQSILDEVYKKLNN